jgi:hypothetical protein
MARNSFPMKLDFTRVQNLTTAANSLTFPNPMGPQTYGVLITALANTWVYFGGAASAGIASASQTVANPGVFTTATQAFTAGLPVYLTGTAPGGFSLNTVYYVIATGLTTTACELSATYGGTGIQCTASAACTINPLTAATATNSLLIKSTDFAEEYGISPGQYISVLENGSSGSINIVELTH